MPNDYADIDTDLYTVTEIKDGRSQAMDSAGNYVSLEMQFLVSGLPQTGGGEAEGIALEAVRRHVAKRLHGMVLDKVSLVAAQTDGRAFAKATYKNASYSSHIGDEEEDDPDATDDDRQIQYSGTSSTAHMDFALATVKSFGDVPSDNGGAINADENGQIHGIDVPSSGAQFTETHYFSNSKFNAEFVKRLCELQFCVNDAAFRGFRKGEVRFDMWTASRPMKGTRWTVQFTFTIALNEEARSVGHGDTVRIPSKDGWDYVSLVTGPAEEGSDGHIIHPPKGGYIQRVFPYRDFRKLGIKTGVL